MRKILTQLLVVLLSMPYLACAMPVCGHEAAIIQLETQPCAGHDKISEHQGHHTAEVMFLSDCAGVDLKLIQHDSALQKADFKSDSSAISEHEPELFKAQAFVDTIVWPIWDASAHPPPNIILATQRFRL